MDQVPDWLMMFTAQQAADLRSPEPLAHRRHPVPEGGYPLGRAAGGEVSAL